MPFFGCVDAFDKQVGARHGFRFSVSIARVEWCFGLGGVLATFVKGLLNFKTMATMQQWEGGALEIMIESRLSAVTATGETLCSLLTYSNLNTSD